MGIPRRWYLEIAPHPVALPLRTWGEGRITEPVLRRGSHGQCLFYGFDSEEFHAGSLVFGAES